MVDNIIGLILHFSESEYQKTVSNWAFELPERYIKTTEQVMAFRYVAFAVDGRWRSIARIGAWHVQLGKGIHTAELSLVSTCVSKLGEEISKPQGNYWLNNYQQEAVDFAMKGERVLMRPDPVPPSLDFEEAAGAIARRFGVNSSQVEISINRKRDRELEPFQSGASPATN